MIEAQIESVVWRNKLADTTCNVSGGETAHRKPVRAVFRDSSFACSPEKILASNAIVRVI
ncbi:MAG: hypothetical protein DDT37_01833 [Firmicutes bacterium]|nr:hypothetical protein [candidate division NPL-UPA2 bacterium]